MWTLSVFVCVYLFSTITAHEEKSERPRLYGVPVRRAIVDNNDPNHLKAIVENAHRRIPFDRLEPDKADSIFATMDKNPLTRTTLDTTLPYTKAPVNIDDILRKRRSPIVPELPLESKNVQEEKEETTAEKITTVKPSTKRPRKANIMWVSEMDEDPFATKGTPAPKAKDQSLVVMESEPHEEKTADGHEAKVRKHRFVIRDYDFFYEKLFMKNGRK
uniref:Uncharacterized protein n=1 Tax=Steinernema glaseri TaxID=37863 RepID=A0A1I7Z1X2_9BILA